MKREYPKYMYEPTRKYNFKENKKYVIEDLIYESPTLIEYMYFIICLYLINNITIFTVFVGLIISIIVSILTGDGFKTKI